MGSSPTGNSIPQEVIHDFKGLNDQQDSVNRPPGSVTDMRNMYDETSHDADRRPGRDFVSLDDGNAVGIIYQLSWADGGVNVINQSGDKVFTDPFDFPNRGEIPDLSPPDQPPGPPGPFGPPIKFAKKPTGIPDLVPLIRAMSESLLFANNDSEASFTPPNQRYEFEFWRKNRDGSRTLMEFGVRTKDEYLKAQAHGWWPVGKTGSPISPTTPYTDMPLDFYWVDYVGNPSLAVQDLQNLIDTYNSVIVVKFVKTYPDPQFYGKATMPNYTGADIFVQPAFSSTFKEVWGAFCTTVNAHLTRIKKTTTQQQVQERSGTASDGVDCTADSFVNDPPLLCQYHDLVISGYSNTFFDTSTSTCNPPSVIGSYPGTLGPGISDGDLCVFDDCGWGSTLGNGGKAINTVEFSCATVKYNGGTSFSIHVECNGGGNPTADTVWDGSKDDATSSPAGIYTRTGGTSPTPATLTITCTVDTNFC